MNPLNGSHTVVLASKSPRRQQLLRDMGISFDLRTADVDESFPDDMPVTEVAAFLARKKAQAIPVHANEILITADTTVVLGEQILNKPADEAEARYMLQQLSGAEHAVITGVCLRSLEKEHAFSVSTQVVFRELTEAELTYYIKTYQPFDKAGAYGIQEWIGQIGIERIEGSYFNVVGLPTAELYTALQAF